MPSISGSNAVLTQTTDTGGSNPPANYAIFPALTEAPPPLVATSHSTPALPHPGRPPVSPLTLTSSTAIATGTIGVAYSDALQPPAAIRPIHGRWRPAALCRRAQPEQRRINQRYSRRLGHVLIRRSNRGQRGAHQHLHAHLTILSLYQTWQSGWFNLTQLGNPAISGDTADPAGDGIPNLLNMR